MNYNLLSIDESGKASYSHRSQLFILSGVVIPEKFKIRLDINIRKLKKKFFKDEEVVLHGRDIARKAGEFTCLQDIKTETLFWNDLISIFNDNKINLIFVIVNKNEAKKAGWQVETILERSYKRLLELFALNKISKQTKGKIIAESDSAQDPLLIKAHNALQSQGVSGQISAFEYQQAITCLSLVNKANLDVDVQIADTVVFIAEKKYYLDQGKFILNNTIDKMKIRFLERKLTNKTDPSFLEVII
ncbi:MAG: hypothetical protein Q7R46_01220 [bacterium]|nr:hypothetical protein [bacterium]